MTCFGEDSAFRLKKVIHPSDETTIKSFEDHKSKADGLPRTVN